LFFVFCGFFFCFFFEIWIISRFFVSFCIFYGSKRKTHSEQEEEGGTEKQ
jgi:hypothetical protein